VLGETVLGETVLAEHSKLGPMTKAWGKISLALALLHIGCSDPPCEAYCHSFAEKASSCDLGGPEEDAYVEACTDQLESQFTDDQCEQADKDIDLLSCDQFRDIVCAQPNADQAYNCVPAPG
jgi:hypothetical protein